MTAARWWPPMPPDGKLLWHFNTSQSWRGGPMTYMLDGKQYIGVAAGNTILAFALP